MRVEITRHKSGQMMYSVTLFGGKTWLNKGNFAYFEKEIREDILSFIDHYKRSKDRWVVTKEQHPRAIIYIFTLLA